MAVLDSADISRSGPMQSIPLKSGRWEEAAGVAYLAPVNLALKADYLIGLHFELIKVPSHVLPTFIRTCLPDSNCAIPTCCEVSPCRGAHPFLRFTRIPRRHLASQPSPTGTILPATFLLAPLTRDKQAPWSTQSPHCTCCIPQRILCKRLSLSMRLFKIGGVYASCCIYISGVPRIESATLVGY